jgi:hypothetical protein
MTNSITPPSELVQQWVAEIWHEGTPVRVALSDEHIATRAAQWGADHELEACCRWLNGGSKIDYDCAALLRAARRPKPPSLKEQAMEELDGIAAVFRMSHGGDLVCDKIRRALEALDE